MLRPIFEKLRKNFIILRLGSVYGYSTDTARIDIMVNYFSKLASHDGLLKLFAGGRQIKSLVPLIDVARCFKFMEEREDLSSEIYNLTKDYNKLTKYQNEKLDCVLKSRQFSPSKEKNYKKIVDDILENIKTLQLSPSVLEELVQKLHLNKG